jgi:DNA-directed RNA polymerase sigma subunit (sigma70/sigma32)
MQKNQLDGEDGRGQDNPALNKVMERNIRAITKTAREYNTR